MNIKTFFLKNIQHIYFLIIWLPLFKYEKTKHRLNVGIGINILLYPEQIIMLTRK